MTEHPQLTPNSGILALSRALAKISTPKVDLWRFNQHSTLEAVFAPIVLKAQMSPTSFSSTSTSTSSSTVQPNTPKMRNKFITYNDTPVEVADNSVYGKIRVACTCTADNRTPEMLVLLDSIACSPFFRSFHVTWREQILRRIEIVKIKKGVVLFTQNEPAKCAYFLLSGRLVNEILIKNEATDLLVKTAAPTRMFEHQDRPSNPRNGRQDRQDRQDRQGRTRQESQQIKEYMKLKPFMPGSEIDTDCLRPSRKGVPLRTKRNRTVTAMDDVHLFKLTLESFKDAVAVQDFNEDWGIWNFFTTRTAGGLGEKVFSTFSQSMEQQWKEMWHLITFPGNKLIAKQGNRALKVYVLSTGSVDVLRLNATEEENKQLLVIDKPRCGEFILTSASEIIASVLKTIPIYKTHNETSLISKAATDCYEADADHFYNFCYKYKWFAKLMKKYFDSLGLNMESAKASMYDNKTWNKTKSGIVKSNVGVFFRNNEAKGLQKGTIEAPVPSMQPVPTINRKKKKIKPLLKKKVNTETIVVKKKQRKKRRKKTTVEKKQDNHAASTEMLNTSSSIYDRLERARQTNKQDESQKSMKRNCSQPILPAVKERLKQRQEDSLRLHKNRYGTHHLIRGSDLRWFIKGNQNK